MNYLPGHNRLSSGKVFIHVADTALDCVLLGADPALHGQVLLRPLQLPVEELRVVLPLRLLVLLGLLRALLLHAACSLLVPPIRVRHHLGQFGLSWKS